MKKIFLSLSLIAVTQFFAITDEYQVKIHTGSDLQSLFPFMAKLTCEVFSQYPYLYAGSASEVYPYMDAITNHPHSATAVAYYNNIPVGFLSGVNLLHQDPLFSNSIIPLLTNSSYNPKECYYFSSIIIEPEHRGKHLSPKIFSALETYASNNGYTICCLGTESHEVHPMKPENYRTLGSLWTKLGYIQSSITAHSSWSTFQANGSIANQQHPLNMWFKKLRG